MQPEHQEVHGTAFQPLVGREDIMRMMFAIVVLGLFTLGEIGVFLLSMD